LSVPGTTDTGERGKMPNYDKQVVIEKP
jgi:hypothetical protein